MNQISIIVPVLNEAPLIEQALSALQPLRARGHEVIVVDGGSRDRTAQLAVPLADRVLTSPRGRAAQMNVGARASQGSILLFLHADTRLPPRADELVLHTIERSGRAWGRFDVRLQGRHPLLRVVAGMMNLRSRASAICTGDQALFMSRQIFERAGGYPSIALMEDIELCRRLRKLSAPVCLRACVQTSARRWEQNGVARTIALMMWLRLRYFFGASPARLARLYDGEHR